MPTAWWMITGVHDSGFFPVLAAIHAKRLSLCWSPSDDHRVYVVLVIHRQGWLIMPHFDGAWRKHQLISELLAHLKGAEA